MRKKLFAAMIVAVVAVAASYNVYQSQNTNTLSDLALANVEALAQNEGLQSRVCRWDWTSGGCLKVNFGSQCGLVGSDCSWL